jgi:uncharacterized protein
LPRQRISLTLRLDDEPQRSRGGDEQRRNQNPGGRGRDERQRGERGRGGASGGASGGGSPDTALADALRRAGLV